MQSKQRQQASNRKLTTNFVESKVLLNTVQKSCTEANMSQKLAEFYTHSAKEAVNDATSSKSKSVGRSGKLYWHYINIITIILQASTALRGVLA